MPKFSSSRSALEVLLLSAWCGLAGGLLEVGARVLFRAIEPTKRLYLMTRHFVWLTPLVNLLLFLCLGLCLAGLIKLWPRLGAWLSPRLLCALVFLPMIIVAGPQIMPAARFVLALGIASRLVPWLAHDPAKLRGRLAWSFPGLVGLVIILAGLVQAGDWFKQSREARRALPTAGSPNVLLIVLDTVRADRLSLYGYRRSTSPTLERLAERGIRFDAARASAPWTLTSHASFFSGCWPHELDIEWQTPLLKHVPMLAEYLADRGYSTSGIVSNAAHCSYDTGLDRGFTHYEDYLLDEYNILQTAVLVEQIRRTGLFLAYWALRYDAALLELGREYLEHQSGILVRRDAESINSGFLSWIDQTRDRSRPFFAFLNYLDAHVPYKLPPGGSHRFGEQPRSRDEIRTVYVTWSLVDKLQLPKNYRTMASDSYDDCIAYLDEKLGQLLDDLAGRGVLDTTWVVIVGDHGEGLGEHDLFEHGESLYSTEIRVPLLILPPKGQEQTGIVRDPVSLRDLPATIVELVGQKVGAPFPGQSLAHLWRSPSQAMEPVVTHEVLSELASPSPRDSSHGRSPARRGSLVSLAAGDLVYIQNQGDGTEELYNERDDPRELSNLATSPAMEPVLMKFRQELGRIKNGVRDPAP